MEMHFYFLMFIVLFLWFIRNLFSTKRVFLFKIKMKLLFMFMGEKMLLHSESCRLILLNKILFTTESEIIKYNSLEPTY